jgi:hypothetical protein
MGLLFSLIGGRSLFEAAAGILKAIFEFFKTPVGQFVGIALLIAGAYVGGKVVEHHKLTVKHKAEIVALNAAWQDREKKAAAAYEQSRVTRDFTIATDFTTAVDGQLATLKSLTDTLNLKVKAYETEHPKAAPQCRVTGDLVRRRDGMLNQRK